MGKKSKKSSSASGSSKRIEIQEPVFTIEEPKSEKKTTNKVEEKEMTQGEKKLLRQQQKSEEAERQSKAPEKSEIKPKAEKKKNKTDLLKHDEKKEKMQDPTSYNHKYNYNDLQKQGPSISSEEKAVDVCLTDGSNNSQSTVPAWDDDKNTNQNYNRRDKNEKTDYEIRKRKQSRERGNDKHPTRSDSHNYYDQTKNQNYYGKEDKPYGGNKSIGDRYSGPNNDRSYFKNSRSQFISYNDVRKGGSFLYEQHRSDNRKDNHLSNADFEEFCSKLNRENINFNKVKEISGDLFTAPKEYALGHCVAEDFSMGAGIALQFRKNFSRVASLLEQNVRTGGVAILEHKGRYIYYLVTKKHSGGKPTLLTLWLSIKEMKKHMVENKVMKLAIPQIGCGLDRLDWGDVKQMLEYIFQDVDVEIEVYSLDYGQSPPDVKAKKGFKRHAPHSLIDIQSGTGLVYFGTEDSHITDEIISLDSKYPGLITFYQNHQKSLGNVIRYEIKGKDIIYGFIWKRKNDDTVNYTDLEKCCFEFKKLNRTDEYFYFGFDAYCDEGSIVLDKIINVIQSVLFDNDISICWPEKIRHLMPNVNY